MSVTETSNQKRVDNWNLNPPRGGITRQCQHCFKFEKSPDLVLKSCSACKSSHYCSPECQKADWPEHKAMCKMKREWKAHVKEMDRLHTGQGGLSHHALQESFKKWRQTHRIVIQWATAQALTLDKTPERLSTHGLFIIAKPNPHAIDSTPPGRSFDLQSVVIESIDEMRKFIPQNEESQAALNDLVGPRSDELRRKGGMGFAIVLMILLVPGDSSGPPVAQLLPMGFPERLDQPSDPHWRENLNRAVKAGGGDLLG